MNEAAQAPSELRAQALRRVLACVVVALALAMLPALREGWAQARELSIVRAAGLVALGTLLASLAVTPARALFTRSHGVLTPTLRRALGMAAAWLAIGHAWLAFAGPLRAEPHALVETSHALSGLTALCALSVLLATSFASVVNALRLRAFKELHRLAYLAALIVVQHVAFSPDASRRLVLGLLATVVVLVGLRAWRGPP